MKWFNARPPRFLKPGLAMAASRVPANIYQRLLAFPLLEKEFGELSGIPMLKTREDLWAFTIDRFVPAEAEMTFVEFGVWMGESMRYFAGRNSNPASRFFGFDSFEGLPEDWDAAPKGAFDVSGAIPRIDDERITFVKGWFQDSWDGAYAAVSARPESTLVVHYDADLYSSTLYALAQVDRMKRKYIAIFDEFVGHETRALYNYCQSFLAEVKFLAKTDCGYRRYPTQLVCEITPRSARP